MTMDKLRIERAVHEILAAIGEDPEREELRETPKRVAEACEAIFSGVGDDPARYLEEAFEGDHRDLILIRDIPLYSMCEHHLVPMVGKAHVGYVPDGKVIGLSEIVNIVEAYARRPQIQERLTAQIADLLFDGLGSRGSMVVIEAEQLCMTLLGSQKPGSVTVTSASRGVFEEDGGKRAEFTTLMRPPG
ncbi:MAG: GTP cyclohydrolase I FolE [Rubrobacteraceae bacterium]|jgi:GTP cyclohydrolase I|nr:GTP cyclohydrolase I FolE [Rubrobacter sp.]